VCVCVCMSVCTCLRNVMAWRRFWRKHICVCVCVCTSVFIFEWRESVLEKEDLYV
jgi:hypothetical protein